MEETSLAAGMAQTAGLVVRHQYTHVLLQRLLSGLQMSLPLDAVRVTYISQDGSRQEMNYGDTSALVQSHDAWLRHPNWQQGTLATPLDDDITLYQQLAASETSLTLAFTKPTLSRWVLLSMQLRGQISAEQQRLLCLASLTAWREIDRLVLASPCEHPRPSVLTEREQDVLHWLCKGKGSWEIARILAISERTVKYHVAAILGKFGVDNRIQLLVKVLREQLGNS